MTVDYYSDFFKIDRLTNTTRKEVITKHKQNFSRHWIPSTVISDNGPPFQSGDFAKFAKTYEFRHKTSSPYHAKSNGKVENAIKTATGLMQKAKHDNKDIYLA